MADLDVTDLLSDPVFTDPMQIIDRVPQVNSYGENVLTECSTDTYGSIQPLSGETMQRIPEAVRVENMRSFWVRGLIVASEPGKYSAVLVFNGLRYNVKHVFDWTNAGSGWSEGACVAEVPAP